MIFADINNIIECKHCQKMCHDYYDSMTVTKQCQQYYVSGVLFRTIYSRKVTDKYATSLWKTRVITESTKYYDVC